MYWSIMHYIMRPLNWSGGSIHQQDVDRIVVYDGPIGVP